MPNIENNTMSTFTIGGKTYQVEDASARSDIQQINTVLNTKADTSDMSNYYTKSETYSKSEVDNLINSRREKQTIYITHSAVVANDASKITSISNLSPNLSLLDLINTPVVINNERVTYIK